MCAAQAIIAHFHLNAFFSVNERNEQNKTNDRK